MSDSVRKVVGERLGRAVEAAQSEETLPTMPIREAGDAWSSEVSKPLRLAHGHRVAVGDSRTHRLRTGGHDVLREGNEGAPHPQSKGFAIASCLTRAVSPRSRAWHTLQEL